ncbi:MAG: TrkH family potassium uptake protein [Ruminococcus sp.]|nr:TrkH family potassium uptake protein [Ruminococcus sp.]
MNRSIIKFILGHVLVIEGLLMLLPCAVALFYGEGVGVWYLLSAALAFALGMLLRLRKPKSTVFYLKEGCMTTALSWLMLSFFGCLPFWLGGEIPSFTDAMFETVSGFTTTGASILSDVESLSHAALFWRSFTHWIGGMGVLVFLLAIIPMSGGGGSNMNLMKSESPGPSVGKLVPKIKATARLLYIIYLAMTVLEFILLLFGKMNVFESMCTAFGTAGTGGFGFRNDSFASFSPYIQWVVTIFMILFGVNFNFYYFMLYRQFKKALLMEEVRYYFIIIILAITVIFANILDMTAGIADAIRQSSFQVASVITTTGFSTVDFNMWPSLSKTILVLIMFCGACAGSTGGGMKVSRFIILFKSMGKELNSYIHPKSIQKIKLDKKPVEHEVVRATNAFVVAYLIVYVVSLVIIALDGRDLITTFTSVAATINNIGPGLELCGPAANFGFFSTPSKFVLMFDMLAGRLEIFPMLLLFYPGAWKDMLSKNSKKKDKSFEKKESKLLEKE